MKEECDDSAKTHQEKAINTDVKAREDVELPLQELRDLDDPVLRTHKIGGRGHRCEYNADREKHLIQGTRIVKTRVEGALQHHPRERRYNEGHRQTIEEGHTPTVHQYDGNVAAQHGERAVRQVDEVHDAEGDTEADGEQKQERPGCNSIEQDGQHGILFRLDRLSERAIRVYCREAVEFNIVQVAVHPLHLAYVHILNDVARLGVDGHLASRAHPAEALSGLNELVALG